MTENHAPELTPAELRRYSRQLILPGVGLAGQKKLKAARVLIVGLGGLGSPVALYLAGAGIGTLGLVDFDTVDESNLQRQILHTPAGIGMPKVESARRRLEETNPDIRVRTFPTRFAPDNALDIAQEFDLLVDCSDTFPGRYLCNDVAVLLGKPDVYGSVYQYEGRATVFGLPDGPCYRCVFPTPPPPGAAPATAEGGVLGVVAGLIGLIQATETIKWILGLGEPLRGSMQIYDAAAMTMEKILLRKNPHCAICSAERTLHHLMDYDKFCGGGQPQTEAPLSAHADRARA
jgi:sulfur-carrier protein adenylyltransferase/sulfurtransferase